jgi:hypothetical protein
MGKLTGAFLQLLLQKCKVDVEYIGIARNTYEILMGKHTGGLFMWEDDIKMNPK